MIPVSVVLTSLFNLTLNLLVAFIFILAFGVSPRWTWLLLAAVVVALLLITVAVAMIVSSLFPRYRDIGIVWSVTSTALFYATPVLYPLELVGHTMRSIVSLNPLAPILEQARRWVIDPHASAPAALAGGSLRLLIPAGIYIFVCAAAVWIFRREAPRIAEAL